VHVVCVTVYVKPAEVKRFLAATLDNAKNTRRESGNLRFDVLQAEDDPSRFMLYEAYERKEDFVAHQQTDHYQRWKQAVAEWMSQPRQGVKHRSVFFDNDEK
jgi:(4S)-4-hydroxy-5-phosphonooxypentane-2,3-dione isomerase